MDKADVSENFPPLSLEVKEPLPSELSSSYDVTTWVAFKALFRVLQAKGVIGEADMPELAKHAAASADEMRRRGETKRYEAAEMAVDWYANGAQDAPDAD